MSIPGNTTFLSTVASATAESQFAAPSDDQWSLFANKSKLNATQLKAEYNKCHEALKEIGITHQQVADRLKGLIARGEALLQKNPQNVFSYRKAILEGGTIEVSGFESGMMGNGVLCPFSKNDSQACGKGKRQYEIVALNADPRKKVVIKISELQLLHVIPKHGCFSAFPTSSKLNPVEICKVLKIQPDIDYSKDFTEKTVWKFINFDPYFSESRWLSYDPQTIIKLTSEDGAYAAEATKTKDGLLLLFSRCESSNPVRFIADGHLLESPIGKGLIFYGKEKTLVSTSDLVGDSLVDF